MAIKIGKPSRLEVAADWVRQGLMVGGVAMLAYSGACMAGLTADMLGQQDVANHVLNAAQPFLKSGTALIQGVYDIAATATKSAPVNLVDNVQGVGKLALSGLSAAMTGAAATLSSHSLKNVLDRFRFKQESEAAVVNKREQRIPTSEASSQLAM